MRGGIVVGVLNNAAQIEDSTAAGLYRGLTLSWLRYGYRDEVIEHRSVDDILRDALAGNRRYCFIQSYGCVISERWRLTTAANRDFFVELRDWASASEFLVVGSILPRSGSWYGLATHAVLVDLDTYQQLGAPSFGLGSTQACQLPIPTEHIDASRVIELLPTDTTQCVEAVKPGWNLIRAGLAAGLSIHSFPEPLDSHLLNLEATCASRRAALQPYFGEGILAFDPANVDASLSDDQRAFLATIHPQASGARRGIFLWNIEPYDDIEHPDDDFESPVTSLYTVAAGFKPCRMLKSHGIGPNTRVVYFDYSQRALQVREWMTQTWDGRDFPSFVEHLFDRFPHPDTFYQLWDNMTPETAQRGDIQRLWDRELARWGGVDAFAEFWGDYRRLDHHYVCCDLLGDLAPLLNRVKDEPNSLIWWSNAFFTMHGNWFMRIEQRQQAYERFVSQLAELNPRTFVFGSDFNNTNVNGMQAAEYWQRYRQSPVDAKHPGRFFRTAIRM